MKKLLFFAMMLLFQLHYAMEVAVQEPQKIWRKQFKNLPKGTYNASVGYNLRLELFEDNREQIVHTCPTPTLLVHGFGASPYTMIEYARIVSPHKIPGDLLVFSFADAYYNGLFITKSSLGQARDIKSLLVAMRCAYDSQFPACNLFGQSRGAGTIANALAVLNENVNNWDKELDAIKYFFYKDEDRVAILDMIKKGVVVLDTPMVSVPAALETIRSNVIKKDLLDKFIEFVVSIITRGNYSSKKMQALNALDKFIEKFVVPIITFGNYSSDKMQALNAVENLPEGLRVLVSYQKNDRIVGNVHDKGFAEKLIDRLGKENVWIVLGNDGGKKIDDETLQALGVAAQTGDIQSRLGISLPYKHVFAHNAGYFILLQRGVLNAFFKRCEASYFKDETKLIEGSEILRKSQPGLEDFDTYFDNYDMHNTKQKVVVQNIVLQKNGSARRILFISIIAVLLNVFMHYYAVTI